MATGPDFDSTLGIPADLLEVCHTEPAVIVLVYPGDPERLNLIASFETEAQARANWQGWTRTSLDPGQRVYLFIGGELLASLPLV